jgi:putative intracellular protease/amidase
MTPTRKAHVALYNQLADWEVGHLLAELRSGRFTGTPFEIVTVAETTDPITTMGGIRMLPDMTIADLDPADSALLVLPGGDLWDGGGGAVFAETAQRFLDAGVPVAAICGATAGLAREGLLDDRDHTSAVSFYLAATGYAGGGRYVEADAVTDGDLITAGPTEPVAFAREILRLLGVYEGEVLDAWYRLFHDSDPAAYGVLEKAGAL